MNSVYEAVFRQDTEGTWLVEVPTLPGCHTYGETLDEARTNLRDALALWLQSETFEIREVIEQRRSA